jgi:chromosomal replication initiator protein
MHEVFSIPVTGAAPTSIALRPSHRLAQTGLGEFIAGPENRLAAIAVRSVFEERAAQVSPLVLYGPCGCGKSHLALGLADWWQRHFPTAGVLALTASEFAQQYADAVENDRVSAWRTKLQALDLLVIDGLDPLVSKRGAQQELRSLLDALSDRQAIVVVTSRLLPQSIDGLAESLRSRLASGLAVPISVPAAATRQVILERYAEARGIVLSKRLIKTLADRLHAPAPALLGALLELQLRAQTDGKPLDSATASRYLARLDQQKVLPIRDIARATAKYFGLTLADLRSPSRRKAIVGARNTAVFLARRLTSHSFEQIGDYFGGRDHTTVLHGFRTTEKLVKTNAATRQAITELKQLLSAP